MYLLEFEKHSRGKKKITQLIPPSDNIEICMNAWDKFTYVWENNALYYYQHKYSSTLMITIPTTTTIIHSTSTNQLFGEVHVAFLEKIVIKAQASKNWSYFGLVQSNCFTSWRHIHLKPQSFILHKHDNLHNEHILTFVARIPKHVFEIIVSGGKILSPLPIEQIMPQDYDIMIWTWKSCVNVEEEAFVTHNHNIVRSILFFSLPLSQCKWGFFQGSRI